MNRNGRNQNQLVAELLEVLSEQVNRLRAENKSLQAEIERLRPFTDDYPSLMDFLAKVAEVVAEHPDAEQASTYFAAALQTARRRLNNDT